MSFGAIGGGGGGGGGGLVADAINDGTTTVAPSQNAVYDALASKANSANPTFTGTPAAPTATQGTNTTQVATTAYVQTEAGLLIPRSLVDAKGDLLLGTADNTVSRLAVGSNGRTLVASSGDTPGVKWAGDVPLPVFSYISGAYHNVCAVNGAAGNTNTFGRDIIHFTPVLIKASATFDRIQAYASQVTSGKLRLGLYNSDPVTGLPTSLVFDSGEIDISGTAGDKTVTINQAIVGPGLYHAAFVAGGSTDPTLGSTTTSALVPIYGCDPSVANSSGGMRYCRQSYTYAALPSNVGTLTYGNLSNNRLPIFILRAA